MTFTVMTVCTGNICRSPMAEVVLRAAFERAGSGDRVTVRSTAVTSEEVGSPIDPRAARTLAAAGYPVPARKAVRVLPGDVEATDLVLAMTRQHVRALRAVGFPAERIALLRAFEGGVPTAEPHLVEAPDTPDPWYGGAADFVDCLATIEVCAPAVVEYVERGLDRGTPAPA